MTLSIAIVPNAPGHPEEGGDFSKWMWEYWRGVYDLKALGQAADLISLMTYDQHTRWTTPGLVAGMPWTKKHLEYALTQVPKEKLSLGIPTYGYRWFTGNPVRKDGTENSNISGTYIDADKSFPLAIAQKANVQWDPIEQESWFYFYRDNMREWVFRPDAHSFRARYDLVKQNGLQGFSCWVLGAEDPKMWDELPPRHPLNTPLGVLPRPATIQPQHTPTPKETTGCPHPRPPNTGTPITAGIAHPVHCRTVNNELRHHRITP